MDSSSTSTLPPNKKLKLTIIPPKATFIDLTIEGNTPSPKTNLMSPIAPNAPIKTPSTQGTSSSTSSKPSSSPFSTFIGELSPLLGQLSPPPRVSNPPPPNTTLSLSPNGPLDYTPSTPPPSPIMGHPIPYNFVGVHAMRCPCCFHNHNLIHSLREEMHYMFAHLEHLLSQPFIPQTPPSSTIIPTPPSLPPPSE